VHRKTNLLQIILALRSASGFSGLLNRRQQKCDQDCDNRNHDQEFNECESTADPARTGLHETSPERMKTNRARQQLTDAPDCIRSRQKTPEEM
jgi:hypothetical protein